MPSIPEEKYRALRAVFHKKEGVARTQEIASEVHPRYLYRLVEEGVVEKVKRGLYCWREEGYSLDQEMLIVARSLPGGVLCLRSALSHYELTTVSPWEYQVALHRDAHTPVLPDYPPIRMFYFSQTQFETGQTTLELEGGTVRIYDLEKTICDCVRYRKTIGQDVVKEALGGYVRRNERDLDKLLRYAERTRISGRIRRYLEVLV